MNSGTHLVSSNTLVDVAYHNIRKDIIEEYLPAGQKINLSDLCTRYGVSPTPINQALNPLMAPARAAGYGLSTGPSWMRYLSCV